MRFDTTDLPGLIAVRGALFADHRGVFLKTMQASEFAEQGLSLTYAEEYVTTSAAGVVRGMHFQLPPHDHDKLVFCVRGSAFDVVLDLRVGSPKYGSVFSTTLHPGDGLYVPSGMAHGFCALQDDTMLAYKVTTEYAPDHDAGLLWSSVPGIVWPVDEPVLSARDEAHPNFGDFESPFRYEGER